MYFSKKQCILGWYVRSYEWKLQLGEIVYKHAKDRGIPEESLSKEYKEAKDLYVKNIEQKVFDFTMVSQGHTGKDVKTT